MNPADEPVILSFVRTSRGAEVAAAVDRSRRSYPYTGIEAFIESISGAVSQRALLRGTYRLRALGIFHRAPTHRADIPPNIRCLPFASPSLPRDTTGPRDADTRVTTRSPLTEAERRATERKSEEDAKRMRRGREVDEGGRGRGL